MQKPSAVSPPREIARRTSFSKGFLELVSSAGMRSGFGMYAELDSDVEIIAHMRKLLWRGAALVTLLTVIYLGWIISVRYISNPRWMRLVQRTSSSYSAPLSTTESPLRC